MSFRITCPKCHVEMECRDDWDGMEATCPQCSRSFVIRRSAPPPGNMPPPFAPPPPPRTGSGQTGAGPAAKPVAGEDSQEENGCQGCLATVLFLLGCGFYLLALIDFCGMFFGYDITGSRWSPLLFSLVGQGLISLAGKCDRNENSGTV